jgi:hypothetical protein
MSRAQDVTGESTDTLMGSCSQNTFKNERLEHHSYRKERNFIGRERLSEEMHSRVRKPGAPQALESGDINIYIYVRLPP